MTEDWDFYFCTVDDKLASIYVDLGAIKMLPIETHPCMAYVRLTMVAPREDGMSSSEEYYKLIAVEDALETLCFGGEVNYVGRCTSDGHRDFYFYIKDGIIWQDRVAECLRAFSDYKYEIGSREDSAWSTYHSYLFPSDVNRQSIENRRVCVVLERNGDKLLVAREVDHWAEFADVVGRDAFVAGAVRLGFAVRALTTREDDGKFCAQLFRSDIPSMNGIDDVTLPLYKLAQECGGNYDGWESVVVRSDPKVGSRVPAETLATRLKNACRTFIGM